MSATTHSIRRPPRTYQVPQRFGAGGMLAMMFVFSVTFATLRHLDADWQFYLFFALLGLAVGVSQMRGGRNPRLASVIAGACVLPLALFAASIPELGIVRSLMHVPLFAFSAILGAGIGYMTGTLLGGAFLLADYLEQHFDPRHAQREPSDSETILALDIAQLREQHQKWLGELPPPAAPPIHDRDPPLRF